MVAYGSEGAWAALGDPTRHAIVVALAERPRAVTELAAELPVSRPAVSQALKVLKDAGLVTERAAGTRRIYRLNPTAVAALRDQLDTFWSRALANFTDTVEQPSAERPRQESS
ncbi:MAG TPA: metalloregulator ArsR/SmtB family transcription factor [Acidothermaceae bacterium]